MGCFCLSFPPGSSRVPHLSQGAPLLPVVLLHHPLNSSLPLSKLVLLPHPCTPGKLLPQPHHKSGHVLLISVPIAHCPSVFQCQVKNLMDPAWLSEPESWLLTTNELDCPESEDSPLNQSAKGGRGMGWHPPLKCPNSWGESLRRGDDIG